MAPQELADLSRQLQAIQAALAAIQAKLAALQEAKKPQASGDPRAQRFDMSRRMAG